jgi:hypothetical protein
MVPHHLVLALLAIALLSRGAEAQWPREIESGNRVRVTVPEAELQRGSRRGHSLRGTVARLDPDTLYLRITDSLPPLAIPRAWIKRLDLSRGVPPRVTNAARVGLFWAAIGALELLLYNGVDDSNTLSAGQATLLGAGVGLALGATFGALYPTERWRRVPLSLRRDGGGVNPIPS